MAGPTAARPTGITILAVLSAIGGVFLILFGIGAVAGGGVLGAAATGLPLAGLLSVIGLIALVVGVADLVLAYGFWNLRPWGWQLGAALQVVSVIVAILEYLSFGGITNVIISIVVSGVILYYLNTPTVRQAFGRPATGWM